MKNQPKVPGGEPAENEYLSGFEDIGGLFGLEYLEKNMGSISAEQAGDLIDSVRSMDADPASKDFQAINTKMGEVLNGLQEIIDGELDPEARNEGESGVPDLRVVEAPADSPEVAAAEERLDHIKEVFDTERGFFDASTLRKVEKWQAELEEMEGLLGKEKTGALYGQLENFKIDAEKAQAARKVVANQPSTQRPAARRSGGHAGGRVARPSTVPAAKKPWYKFW